MQASTYTWERRLLSLAHEAQSRSPAPTHHTKVEADLLKRAYHHCKALTSRHSRSFYLASSLLPGSQRRAARALYAFCRVTDDIVDRPTGNVEARLKSWQRCILDARSSCDDPVAIAWNDTRVRYSIPDRYAEQLIDGVARDMQQLRYQTFDELVTYCYGVASTVGLMSMHIVGFSSPQAIPYAIKLGVALQLTNILRDVAEDWRAGRVYLPQDDLAAFSLSESDLAAQQVDDRWRAFMQFQIERTRQLYAESWPGLALLHNSGRLAIAAAADLYRKILDDIERHDYNVFHRRAFVSTLAKLRRLPILWWQTRAPELGSSSRHLTTSRS
jgi:phytoene synthase